MAIQIKISTGLAGLDNIIDSLRPGDNVVWQTDSLDDYRRMAEPFFRQARLENRKMVYVCFGSREPVFEGAPDIITYQIEPGKGFESFASEVHNMAIAEGRKTFYVFDVLSDLLKYWYADSMIGNFFKVTCPLLYELDTIAYFAILRNTHTNSTIAGIRETTQLLLDLYRVKDKTYIHPIKVWQRYSATMFFPHLLNEKDESAACITASSEAAELFSTIHPGESRPDHWKTILNDARIALDNTNAFTQAQLPQTAETVVRTARQIEPAIHDSNISALNEIKDQLMHMIIGSESRIYSLCDKYFTLNDVLSIASRVIGTGLIGGKSVGMLLAGKILEAEGNGRFAPLMEQHDSFYLGTDIFYSYIVENGWWRLRVKQKTKEGYYEYAPDLRENLKHGRFPKDVEEQFIQILGYFGQSPIILRSSSLLEDNFGNAFAGKYDSIFCANQGTPEERFEAFEQAIRNIYASTMNEDALEYRINRGLRDHDEQMAILIQRVSGDHYGEYFFPHIAGVGYSSNLYVWDKSSSKDAGMLRLVFGLGTRAVDRTVGDYARIVRLDDPLQLPPVNYEDRKKYSQHMVDLLSLRENTLTCRDLEDVMALDIKTDKSLFANPDHETAARLQEPGGSFRGFVPYILDFKKLLGSTQFPSFMRDMLALLSSVYEYPVDIEFTANFTKDSAFKINLLQCRPLQTKGLGKAIRLPEQNDDAEFFFISKGNFMGGNIRLPIDYVVYVDTEAYTALDESSKYSVARLIGLINKELGSNSTDGSCSISSGNKKDNILLAGPGRWGTTTPALGIPVHFAEISKMSVICEIASKEKGFTPELSYGSHFFQDIVEFGIFYAAIFDGDAGVKFNPRFVTDEPNILGDLICFGGDPVLRNTIHVVKTDKLELFSDIITQTVICQSVDK